MSKDPSLDSSTAEDVASNSVTLGSAAFVAAAIAFLVGGSLVIWADPPPSTAPVLGMVVHGLWALAIGLLAIGAVTLTWGIHALRTELSSVLGTGALGLGVVVGVQWVTWAYVDVRAARHEEYELALETVIVPFGAGHVLMYGVFLGAGIAFLGRGLARSHYSHRYVGRAGVAVGVLTVLAVSISMLTALEGGSDGHWLYNVATLLLPVCYLWSGAVGLDLYRRS